MRRAAARVSVLRNASTIAELISTCVMPAFAHPSSAPRYPAADEVLVWMASDIFRGCAPMARAAKSARGDAMSDRLDSMRQYTGGGGGNLTAFW